MDWDIVYKTLGPRLWLSSDVFTLGIGHTEVRYELGPKQESAQSSVKAMPMTCFG